MDEWKVIRAYIDPPDTPYNTDGPVTKNEALEALGSLEDREIEWVEPAREIIRRTELRGNYSTESEILEAASCIGRYAYQYSEAIRNDRDEWKALAMSFIDAIQAKLKGVSNVGKNY
jgi:hypothetical protein